MEDKHREKMILGGSNGIIFGNILVAPDLRCSSDSGYCCFVSHLFNLSNLFKYFVALGACVDLIALRPFPDLFVCLGP